MNKGYFMSFLFLFDCCFGVLFVCFVFVFVFEILYSCDRERTFTVRAFPYLRNLIKIRSLFRSEILIVAEKTATIRISERNKDLILIRLGCSVPAYKETLYQFCETNS